ncbi:ABC transporter substrate-binding protein [Halobacillus massiliensis]|uniref:ABC transporter substrate-binding protein n=1 Tax=Halobacillus massiliensis TaxID=1926286 RepID=UPI0009E3BF4D|nr:ABC transporter substrate-binding protein [Halobacillus massiliensis]
MNKIRGLLFILLMGFLVSGCSNSSSSNGGGEDPHQEITYAATSDVVGLSPIDTNDSISAAMIEQVYETLFTRDPETMEIKPLLAESYENPDENTWEIKLKEDITFHDGTPFNAEAVKYTFEEFVNEERAAPRASLLEPIESIEATDEYTVEIKTNEPYGALLAALSHTNASIVSPEADKNQDINQEPVGTGPFKFDSWSQGKEVVLTKNEEYWRDPAQLEKITMKVVPEYSTAVSMLETGEVQFIDAIPTQHLSRVEAIDGIEVLEKAGTPVYSVGFNFDKAPYNELEFRQAVSHAIDREAYVGQLKGLGIKNESIIGPEVFGYDQSAEEAGYSYDPEAAKQIIEENGYGNEEITLLTANREAYTRMAEVVQSQLSEVGLNVSIESMEWGTFLDTTPKGDFDMTFTSWSNSTADGSELLYPNLHSDNIDSSNWVRYNNSEFDDLVDSSRSQVEQEAREKDLMEANRIAVEDAAWIPMHHGVVTAAFDESVKGIQIDPTGQWSLYNVHRE